MTQKIVKCTWQAADAASLDMSGYEDLTMTPEQQSAIVAELAESLYITPEDVMPHIVSGDILFLYNPGTQDILAAVFTGGDVEYFRRNCVEEDVDPTMKTKSKAMATAVGGGAGGLIGYFAAGAMSVSPVVGAGLGALLGAVGAFTLTGAKKTTGTAGLGRLPQSVMYRPRGPLGRVPRRVQYSPRGPLGCVGCW